MLQTTVCTVYHTMYDIHGGSPDSNRIWDPLQKCPQNGNETRFLSPQLLQRAKRSVAKADLAKATSLQPLMAERGAPRPALATPTGCLQELAFCPSRLLLASPGLCCVRRPGSRVGEILECRSAPTSTPARSASIPLRTDGNGRLLGWRPPSTRYWTCCSKKVRFDPKSLT
jgi:hypothetical protein